MSRQRSRPRPPRGAAVAAAACALALALTGPAAAASSSPTPSPAPARAAPGAEHPGVAQGGARWLGAPPPAAPRRVVSLAPSLTDTVVALGRASLLVGVT